MRRSAWLGLVLLALVPALAHATAVSPPGVNLRWDNCYGDGGAWNKSFACDRNAGSERLVCSFELDQPLLQTSGVELQLELSAAGTSVPAWWGFWSSGSCRQASLSVVGTIPPTAVNCADWSQGIASGGLAAYSVGSHGAQTAQIVAGEALPGSALADLIAGQEYFAAMVIINNTKTLGTGACGGCDVPVCIFLSHIKIATPPVLGEPSRDLWLDRPANYLGSQYVTWQNGYPVNVQRQCIEYGGFFGVYCTGRYNTIFDCVLATPTGSRGSTWGQVKSLYR